MRRQKSWTSQEYTGTLISLAIGITSLVLVTIYLVNKANTSDRKIFRLDFLALLLGLIFEYKRISKKWSTVLWTALGAYFLSFFAFVGGKRQQRVYIFEDRLEMWPYFFLGAFVIIAMVIQYTSATKKLTEGITLLLTIALNYWILANNYWHTASIAIKCLIVANIFMSLFVVYNALSYSKLSKGVRLTLSLWSSVVTLILALDNFLQLYNYRDIEHLSTFSESAFYFFQFFLLGISSIYFAQNLTMVVAYLPAIGEMNEIHLDRFSVEQVYIVDSIIVIAISLIGFTLNYFLHFLPTNFMIWAMIAVTAPLHYVIYKIFA